MYSGLDAKKNGCVSGIRTAGFILSIIAVVFVGLSATFGNTSVPDGTKTIDQLGGGTGFGGVIQPWLRM